jgi:Flp pilus assembly protein TadD
MSRWNLIPISLVTLALVLTIPQLMVTAGRNKGAIAVSRYVPMQESDSACRRMNVSQLSAVTPMLPPDAAYLRTLIDYLADGAVSNGAVIETSDPLIRYWFGMSAIPWGKEATTYWLRGYVPPEFFVRQGDRCREEGEFGRMEHWWIVATWLDPTYERARRRLASHYLVSDRSPEAVGQFTEWAGALPAGSTERLLLLGEAATIAGDYESAVLYYRQAIHETPGDGRVWELLGDLYVRIGEREEAVEVYYQALTVQPSRWSTLIRLGNLQSELGNYGAAGSALLEAQQVSTNVEVQQDAVFGLALNDMRAERYESAIGRLRSLLAQDPANWRVRHMLGKALLLSGTPHEASVELRQAARDLPTLNPGIAPYGCNLYSDLGDALSALGKCDEATEAYERALSFVPESAYVRSRLHEIATVGCDAD